MRDEMAKLRENEIRERAYQHYVNRGRKDGFAMQDWLTAERELREGRFAEPVGAVSRVRSG
jgi:hypothetical protein